MVHGAYLFLSGISPLARSGGLNDVFLEVDWMMNWSTGGISRSVSKRGGQTHPGSLSGRGYLWDELHRGHWEPRGGGLLGAHPITGQSGEQRENHHDSQPRQRSAARRSHGPQQEVHTWFHTLTLKLFNDALESACYFEIYASLSVCLLRDSLVLTKSGPAEFRFRLAGVQLSDRGFYWCDITAWTKQQPGQAWTKATSGESNKVRIDFQENGESLLCVRCSFVHIEHQKYFSMSWKMKTLLPVVSWEFSEVAKYLEVKVLFVFNHVMVG